jgi:phosphate acetyltransferase
MAVAADDSLDLLFRGRIVAKGLYIAAMEPNSGKSLVVLGAMETLSRRVEKLGFFRPVVHAGPETDSHIQLVSGRYDLPLPPDQMFAVRHLEARQAVSEGNEENLFKRILSQFREVERQCDYVVCEGTDFAGLTTAFEFDFNAQVANHLGCPVVIVTNGHGKHESEVIEVARVARQEFLALGCTVAATIVNRVQEETVAAVEERLEERWPFEDPAYVIPENSLLSKPTLGEIARDLQAECLYEGVDGLARVVHDYKVAAMHVPQFLEYLSEGTLVICPGDRADIVLASVMAVFSDTYPHIAGIVLTGDKPPATSIRKLIDGIHRLPIPVIRVSVDTFSAAMRVNAVPAAITSDNQRKIATALGMFEAHVNLPQLEQRLAVVRSSRVTPLMFEYELIERAKRTPQHIVLPEGTDERILRASEILLQREVVDITLLGPESEVREKIAALSLDLRKARIVDPVQSPWHAEFVSEFVRLRKHKGVTQDQAEDIMHDATYFGTMMVHKDLANGMVSGAVHTTANTIRPAFQIIRAKANVSVVSSVFLMCLEDRVLVYGDCAVIPRPTAEQLADIAISSAETARMFDIEPRVAMLSYSTGKSGHGSDVEKVRQATALVRQRAPDLIVDGPIQYDAAVDPKVAQKKMPGSKVAGRATVFVFPDLNTGNNTYKAVQRTAGAVAIGPVLQGLNKPVNDLSRGCTVTDVVNTVAITAVQAGTAS